MTWEKVAVGAGVLGVLALLAVLLWPVLRHRLIYPGGRLTEARADPALHGLPRSEQVWLEAEDGVRIHAWWTPADPPGPARGAVVYCHGNAESMATRAWIARRLARLGFHTLLFDYRGYGLSQGRSSEEGLAADARAAWRYVVEERGIAPDRVVLMGHSLGSAVATRLALEIQAGRIAGDDGAPAALVVGAPFPDMPTLFHRHAPWLPERALRWDSDRHDAGSRLAEVEVPVLVAIGTRDHLVPPAVSRAVAGSDAGSPRAPHGWPHAPQVVTAPADHGTLMGHPEVWERLGPFLRDRVPPGP